MLGCDIIEIARVRKSYQMFGMRFLKRILTEAEQEIFFRRKEDVAFLAGRFAAKEAVSKSCRTGIGVLGFTDIEILPDEAGAPVVAMWGEAVANAELSISHSKDYAIAVYIALK